VNRSLGAALACTRIGENRPGTAGFRGKRPSERVAPSRSHRTSRESPGRPGHWPLLSTGSGKLAPALSKRHCH
jgi:hypothetical protein